MADDRETDGLMKSVMDPIPRITAPEPTQGRAPSHAPPDTRYAPGLGAARGLGWFSIGLGLAELAAPDIVADLTGVRNEGLLQLYGLREIACGVGILSSTRPSGWMWARVAGDALDLVTLAGAATRGDGDAGRALGAGLAVAAVTLTDLACAAQLSTAEALEG